MIEAPVKSVLDSSSIGCSCVSMHIASSGEHQSCPVGRRIIRDLCLTAQCTAGMEVVFVAQRTNLPQPL